MNELSTLKAIRMEWIIILPKLAMLFLLGGIVGGVAASFFAYNSQYLAIGAGIGFLSSFIVEASYFIVFYNFVKCLECGGHLNKFKNGKNVPRKQAHTQLIQGFGCRHCGWKPKSIKVTNAN